VVLEEVAIDYPCITREQEIHHLLVLLKEIQVEKNIMVMLLLEVVEELWLLDSSWLLMDQALVVMVEQAQQVQFQEHQQLMRWRWRRWSYSKQFSFYEFRRTWWWR
jgi:hypothetical protein